ncbi:MAG: DNA methyltransferase [Bacillota bacterium]
MTGLACEWKIPGKRWGHRLHAMCSYMAMFPPSIPHYFIAKCTDPGDVVLDPFSGRGTTPLQACLEGRTGVGNDLNPLAYMLTRAKVDLPYEHQVWERLDQLELGYVPRDDTAGLIQEYEAWASRSGRGSWLECRRLLAELRKAYAGEKTVPLPHYVDESYNWNPEAGPIDFAEEHHHPIWIFYHPETLRQLAYLKSRLTGDRTDTFIAATILGIMHGNSPFYLSIPMPNTFSMTPRYVLKYTYEKGLVLPLRNVFHCLRHKVALMNLPPEVIRGRAFYGDIRNLPSQLEPYLDRLGRRVQLVVSSPPYLKVVKYGLYNWIRLWFLERADAPWQHGDERLDRQVDAVLDDGHLLPEYLEFMAESLTTLYPLLADDGVVALVIGDVEKGKHRITLAQEVWEHSAKPAGFRYLDCIVDSIELNYKVTKIWGDQRGRATDTDRVLLLHKGRPKIKDCPVTW